ncbi:DegT/DnrJ/EryC1/StrS family aminotransferase [Pseudoduganella umbonata]|uniref:Erythromycin biosynthesis sensory transduction protein eryC1 n=1 Tax=Pseudoduganella umbonata TaxID=864828 RepID=A0A4P8HW97_9BURK|nr:DegT/DnrJ/EryC1/StrS family aminotransferase [Pseudoduganella umbonata]MBB3223853.1 dTDP-4-amino-4,6-dideoxygalactose transaminase [Pseudoduganella umbonata]QCP12734.1 erythromycin biosynthesis sensory transduction protein eryC1 [Pseudoduganella umbonata]
MVIHVPLFSSKIANEGVDLAGALQRVLERNWYVLGAEVAAFEAEFAAYLGVESCISVANGTDAMEIALRTLGIGPGKRVALVANAGFYGSTAVHAVGAEPVYVDVDDATLTMAPAALQAVLPTGVDAVIVTHLYGQMADIERIAAFATKARVPLIEDCAQSHGAIHNGIRAGSFGDLACFSFYPTKNLGAIGDGGAITTSDKELDTRARRLRQYGWGKKYHVTEAGGRNSRLDELQAAVLREKLPMLDDWNARRRAIAARYSTAFADFPIRLPASNGDDFVAHLYVIRVPDRAAFIASMSAAGIATDIHYPVPDHLQPAYAQADNVALPVTEAASGSVVTLPCFPGLDDECVERVIAAVRGHFGTGH